MGGLSFGLLLAVAVLTAAADIAFKAASGAYLKGLVPADGLLRANGRFESTLWTATSLGPPLGGALIGAFGPVTTAAVNAVSYLLSALGIRAVGGPDPVPARRVTRLRPGDLLDGWRYILGSPALRPLFANTVLANGLIMASAPLMAVLMLGRLGFAPWQYGLAFGAPCVGGLLGARLSRPLVSRYGRGPVLRVFGALRAVWPVGLAFVQPGPGGLALVIAVQLGLVASIGVYNPVLATYRLEHTPDDRVARTLTAWSVTSSASIALLTAVWGLLAGVVGPRAAVAAAGVLLFATPALLPRVTSGVRPGTPAPAR